MVVLSRSQSDHFIIRSNLLVHFFIPAHVVGRFFLVLDLTVAEFR